MALGKQIPFDNTGVTLAYWRITHFETNALSNTTKVIVSGYLSKEARDDGKRPLKHYNFIWPGAENPITKEIVLAGQAYQACYTKIKSETAKLGLSNPVVFTDAESLL